MATPEDIERIKADLGDELHSKIRAEVAEDLIKSLKGETPDTPPEKKIDLSQAPWVLQGRNPTWEEAIEFGSKLQEVSEDRIVKKVMGKLDDEVKEDEKSREEAEGRAKVTEKAIMDGWNVELADLEKTGKIPPIKDQNDPNDLGRRVRTQIYEIINQRVMAKRAAGQPVFASDYSAKVVYYEEIAGRGRPGRLAPVVGARRGAAPGGGEGVGYKYEDIQKPWETIIAGST